jgi:hypothetical protein
LSASIDATTKTWFIDFTRQTLNTLLVHYTGTFMIGGNTDAPIEILDSSINDNSAIRKAKEVHSEQPAKC